MNVYDTANRLASEIKSSEEYVNYKMAKQAISLKQELKNIQAQKEEVIAADSTEDYQKAADLKTKECQLIEKIDKMNSKMKLKSIREKKRNTI